MYNTEKFYKVIEEQVTSEGQFACIQTDYTEEQEATVYASFYQACASASTNPYGMQYVCVQIMEYGSKAILLESKVFDYRQPEPAPEPEPEEEPEEET